MSRIPALSNKIRKYFEEQGVREVKTPCIVDYPTAEPGVANFSFEVKGVSHYLRTSPESALKQIVCRDELDVFELGAVFRMDEIGKCHLNEFTMLEWYRAGMTYKDLMTDVSDLLKYIGIAEDFEYLAYDKLFLNTFGFSCHGISTDQLKELTRELGLVEPDAGLSDRQTLFDFLSSYITDKKLCGEGMVFVYDYPVELRCYSELSSIKPITARRFELFSNGLELANGYQEILSATEQMQCFKEENKIRMQRGLPEVPFDKKWIRSLEKTKLEKLSGVALGLERTLMKIDGLEDIRMLNNF